MGINKCMIEVEINLFDKLKDANYSTHVYFSEFQKIQKWVSKNCKSPVALGETNSGQWCEIFTLYFDDLKEAIMFKLWWQ